MSTTTVATATTASFDRFRARTQELLSASLPGPVDRLSWDRGRLAAWQRDRLRALLGMAIDRSPFHRRRLAGLDPSTVELEDLASLPVMTKAEMMEAFDDVVTDGRVTRARAEQAVAATTTVPCPIADDYVVLASGGSSGQRGLFAFGPSTFAEFACTLMRPAVSRLGIGAPSAAAPHIAFVAAASPIHATGCAVCMLEGGPVEFDPVAVTLGLASIVERLNELQPRILYGYPDRLVQRPDATTHGHLRAEVEGRAPDLLRYGHLTVHPLVLASPLTANPAVVEHQVRQTPTGADIDVVTTKPVDAAALADAIEGALRTAGLADAVVRVRLVDGLARDPATGKLRMVVPLASAPE